MVVGVSFGSTGLRVTSATLRPTASSKLFPVITKTHHFVRRAFFRGTDYALLLYRALFRTAYSEIQRLHVTSQMPLTFAPCFTPKLGTN